MSGKCVAIGPHYSESISSMRVLITGGAGFIGSHTADLLLARGHSVRVLDALEPPVHRDHQKPDYVPADVDFQVGDVRDRGAWEKALDGVDAEMVICFSSADRQTEFEQP